MKLRCLNKTEVNLDPYLFEFFFYQKMYHLINRGKLCCNASVSYCDINHDLINDSLVDDIEKIALEFGYPKLPVYCESSLDIDESRFLKRSLIGQFGGSCILKTRDSIKVNLNKREVDGEANHLPDYGVKDHDDTDDSIEEDI
ncbi:hypothetical protein [Xenorhabdus anantnagensis]|uniref:Uncharacterized protein n=1 Tax=Xenorhabdus anantnagensis TaxID=3025875 RepID=A0ABT5LRN7_9GAMM|nr:hypothetical protein [Xenorhabdus anantnagensis]MDC9597082.1 hypothetical protein [Xenorhabdus anantnagensis]